MTSGNQAGVIHTPLTIQNLVEMAYDRNRETKKKRFSLARIDSIHVRNVPSTNFSRESCWEEMSKSFD